MLNIENALLENREIGALQFHVSSGAELARAIQAEYPREKIIYNGGELSLEVTRMAVNYGIGRIVVYGTEELKMIERVCKEKSQKINALLHIPAVDHNLIHQFIIKENADFNLKLPQNTSLFSSVFRSMLCSQYVNFLGFHFHMDSQFTDKASCQNATFVLQDLIHNLKQTYGFNTAELSIGGCNFRISRESA